MLLIKDLYTLSFQELYAKVAERCVDLLSTRAPLELFWVLFVLSCDVGHHEIQVQEQVVNFALDTCTYEIFQVIFQKAL
jgi:hypothetical protein